MQVTKSTNGWQAETKIDLADRQIRILTMKRYSGNLTTTVTVGKNEDGMFSYMLYQDFSKQLLSTKCRVTEKAVKEQHSQINIDSIVAEVKEFYQMEEVC